MINQEGNIILNLSNMNLSNLCYDVKIDDQKQINNLNQHLQEIIAIEDALKQEDTELLIKMLDSSNIDRFIFAGYVTSQNKLIPPEVTSILITTTIDESGKYITIKPNASNNRPHKHSQTTLDIAFNTTLLTRCITTMSTKPDREKTAKFTELIHHLIAIKSDLVHHQDKCDPLNSIFPLYAAISCKQYNIAEFLLQYITRTPSIFQALKYLFKDKTCKDERALILLLKSKVKLTFPTNEFLIDAIDKDYPLEMIKQLAAKGMSIDSRDGNSPLSKALAKNRPDIVEYIIQQPEEINIKDLRLSQRALTCLLEAQKYTSIVHLIARIYKQNINIEEEGLTQLFSEIPEETWSQIIGADFAKIILKRFGLHDIESVQRTILSLNKSPQTFLPDNLKKPQQLSDITVQEPMQGMQH